MANSIRVWRGNGSKTGCLTLAAQLGRHRCSRAGTEIRIRMSRFAIVLGSTSSPCTRKDVERLRNILWEACAVFQQKCIYLSVAGKVEFIGEPEDEAQ